MTAQSTGGRPGVYPSRLPLLLHPASGWNSIETQLSFIQVSAWQAQEYGSGGCSCTLRRGVRMERSTPFAPGSQTSTVYLTPPLPTKEPH